MEVKLALLLVLLWFTTTVNGMQSEGAAQEKTAGPTTASVEGALTPNGGPTYVIRVDDMLQIVVWKEPELTATMQVRPDGMVSLPLLDDVQAAGLTPMQLAAFLKDKLKTYVAYPRVTVEVTQVKPHQVYLVGEVLRHGAIPLLPGMTVMQALATAGFTPFANTKAIYVLRNEKGQQQKIPFNYKQAIKGEAGARNIELISDDTIVVP